ncbi:hypothetical protein D6D19_09868, partial [Aureobasidium pullulans]
MSLHPPSQRPAEDDAVPLAPLKLENMIAGGTKSQLKIRKAVQHPDSQSSSRSCGGPAPAPATEPARNVDVRVTLPILDRIKRLNFASTVNVSADLYEFVSPLWNSELRRFKQAVDKILSKREFTQRYGIFEGLCYTQDVQLKIELANVYTDTTSRPSPLETLCGCVAKDFPEGSGKSVTIGGIIEINGAAFALTNGHFTTTALDNLQRSPTGANIDSDTQDSEDGSESILILDDLKLPKLKSTRSPMGYRSDPLKLDLLHTSGGDTVRHGKEWSTISVTEKSLCLPNIYITTESTSDSEEQQRRWYLTAAAETASVRNVIVLTSSEGCCSGTLLANESYLRLPTGDFVLTWMIRLDNTSGLRKGDSGAWVIDKESKIVYGHITAFSERDGYLIPLSHMLKEIGAHHRGFAVLPSPLVYLADLAKYWSDRDNDDLASRFAGEMMIHDSAFDSPGSWLHNCFQDLIVRYRTDKTALIALLKISGKNLPTLLTMDKDFEKYVESVAGLDEHLRWKLRAICREGRELGSLQTIRASGASQSVRRGLYNPRVLQQTPDPSFPADLSKAIEMDDIETLCVLLSHGANPNVKLETSEFALQKASHKGFDAIVRTLIDMGAYVNAQGGRYGNALQAASFAGHDKLVQMLLESGADVNAQGGDYGNALQAASAEGHDKIVQQLLDVGAEVNAQGGEYGNALYAASAGGHDKLVQILLDKGADVNAQDGDYGHALQVASARGHERIVQMLLAAGADVNAQSKKHGNALQAASAGGHDKIVHQLLDVGADVNAQGGHYGNALQAASARGQDKTAQQLLNAGAYVNAQGGHYGNALSAAIEGNHDGIMQMLLKEGVHGNSQNGYYADLLHAAFSRGQVNVIHTLLENGVNINAQSTLHNNALYTASHAGDSKTVQMLIQAGADINTQGGHYGNALQAASAGGHAEIVQLLLDRGADANARNGAYGSALYAASYESHIGIVEILLDAGADISTLSRSYNSALQKASSGGYEKFVRILIDVGADVNAQSEHYGNALQGASERGHDKIVQMLLDAGADINTQGGRYGNALQAASAEGHDKIVHQLLDVGAEVNAQGGEYGSALQAASVRGHDKTVQILLD